jgi:hypothetical protein
MVRRELRCRSCPTAARSSFLTRERPASRGRQRGRRERGLVGRLWYRGHSVELAEREQAPRLLDAGSRSGSGAVYSTLTRARSRARRPVIMAKRRAEAPQGKDVLDELLKAAAKKSDLDCDKELLVRAAWRHHLRA